MTGIAWYSRDQWAQLRRVVADPEELESTYEEWLGVIKRRVPDFIKPGLKLVKVPVDVNDLVSWCQLRGKPIDANARAEYVVEALQRQGGSGFETMTMPDDAN